MSTFQLMDTQRHGAVIKVIGIGGGGGNAVRHMAASGIEGVDFICANTDEQALRNCGVQTTIQLGNDMTKGLGAGMDPDVGRQAALDDRARIEDTLEGADMIFVAAGMGGGTGTGAAPVIAQVAKEMGILCVAVVTKPFGFEGAKRMKLAQEGLDELVKHVDSLITIPNDKLPEVLGRSFSLLNAFSAANDVLKNAVQGIAELITRPGLINVDFADVRTVMSEMGMAMMGAGRSVNGEDRAREAAEEAIASPLLEDVDLAGARGLLVNVSAGENLTIGEFEEVGKIVREITSEDANIIMGTVIDPVLGDELRVTVVATGIGQPAIAAVPDYEPEQRESREANPLQLVKRNAAGEVKYDELERPAVMRKAAAGGGRSGPVGDSDMEYFDVPAFLRRQHD